MEFEDEINFLRTLSVITFMIVFSPIIVLIAIPLGLVTIYNFIRGING